MIPTYPRTLHVGDSGGRGSKHSVPFEQIAGRHLVIEEKVDGSHAGLFFDEEANLRIFARNTILERPVGKDWSLLFQQAEQQQDPLFDVLGTRYVLYGEWSYAMHTLFYDALPAYFLEDDVFDRRQKCFLDTLERQKLSARYPAPFAASVPVLHEGTIEDLDALKALVGPSLFKGEHWREALEEIIDDHDEAEGLYIKVEERGRVEGRYKWIRPSFLEAILNAKQHWRDRPLITNLLYKS